MVVEPLERAIGSLRRSAEAGFLTGLDDAELLRRFQNQRDAAAFEAIVRRHGTMVLAACRKVLTEQSDIEDVFQAAFLILLQDARKIRGSRSIGPWLFGVAHRLAVRLRSDAARRRKHEWKPDRRNAEPPRDLSWREAMTALHEELDKLPDRLRMPLLLCYLEGKTRDEAAREIGCSLNTIKKRLELGRGKLRGRLIRRGLALSAGLLAALGDSKAANGLSPKLLQTTIQGAIHGRQSAGVAALVHGVPNTMISKTVKLTIGATLAAGVLIGAIGMRNHGNNKAIAGEPPAEKAKNQSKQPPKDDEVEGAATYAGRVLDPDGKPLAGAKLYALYYTPKVAPIPVRSASDKNGEFRFSIERKEFDRSYTDRPWEQVVVVAVADGWGVGVRDIRLGEKFSYSNIKLHMVKDDVPISGRVINLQGQPVADASVSIRGLFWPHDGEDLTKMLAQVKQTQEGYPSLREHLASLEGTWMGRDIGRVLGAVKTDADGRFTLRGIGRERVVQLRISGPTTAFSDLCAMTRPSDTFKVDSWRRGRTADGQMTFVGCNFEHLAAPSAPISGVIRDADTGKPIPGAIVESYLIGGTSIAGRRDLYAVADNDGRYRLLGMPKRDGHQLRVRAPDDKPYLMTIARVPDAPGLQPIAVDVNLKRGVWITGRVADKVTGQPVRSWLQYVVLPDNPNRLIVPRVAFESELQTRENGEFRFVGLPGRAVVAASAARTKRYAPIRAQDSGIKGLDRIYLAMKIHGIAEVNPEKNAESATCNLALAPGRTLTVRVVDSQGKPLSGCRVIGVGGNAEPEPEPMPSAEFAVLALTRGESRLLQVWHPERKLAGSLVVYGDDTEPLTIKLKPAAALTGRFITTGGKPLADAEIFSDNSLPVASPNDRLKLDLRVGSLPGRAHTDKDGRFRIECLAADLKYRLQATRGMYLLFPEGEIAKGVPLTPGRTRDLGDVLVKLPGE